MTWPSSTGLLEECDKRPRFGAPRLAEALHRLGAALPLSMRRRRRAACPAAVRCRDGYRRRRLMAQMGALGDEVPDDGDG